MDLPSWLTGHDLLDSGWDEYAHQDEPCHRLAGDLAPQAVKARKAHRVAACSSINTVSGGGFKSAICAHREPMMRPFYLACRQSWRWWSRKCAHGISLNRHTADLPGLFLRACFCLVNICADQLAGSSKFLDRFRQHGARASAWSIPTSRTCSRRSWTRFGGGGFQGLSFPPTGFVVSDSASFFRAGCFSTATTFSSGTLIKGSRSLKRRLGFPAFLQAGGQMTVRCDPDFERLLVGD